jgi:probable O-glycosylation ligase (exosortase A-associated)
LIWIIVISLASTALRRYFTLTTGGNYIVWGPEGTFIGGNNEIGLALIVTIPLMTYLILSSENRIVRYALYVSIVLSIVAILGTYSRGAFLGLVALGVLLALKSRHRFAIVSLVVIVACLAVPFMPAAWSERMETIETYHEDASAMGRINAWGSPATWPWTAQLPEGSHIYTELFTTTRRTLPISMMHTASISSTC